MAFTITQTEIELTILENDKTYSKQRRFFDSLSSVLTSTGHFSSILYDVKNNATDDVEMVLQYKNSNLGIRLRSTISVIQCVRVDTKNLIITANADSSYFSGTSIKTIIFRYSETFFQLILVGLSKSAGGETLLLDAKIDKVLAKQSPSAVYDDYGRIVNFNSGISGITRMTFQNEIFLVRPLVYYTDTARIHDDYIFNNKLFFIYSGFLTVATGNLYIDNLGTRYFGLDDTFLGAQTLIME